MGLLQTHLDVYKLIYKMGALCDFSGAENLKMKKRVRSWPELDSPGWAHKKTQIARAYMNAAPIYEASDEVIENSRLY